ncbi:hypothetical protein ACJX0J_010469, partial [Zea mays]
MHFELLQSFFLNIDHGQVTIDFTIGLCNFTASGTNQIVQHYKKWFISFTTGAAIIPVCNIQRLYVRLIHRLQETYI